MQSVRIAFQISPDQCPVGGRFEITNFTFDLFNLTQDDLMWSQCGHPAGNYPFSAFASGQPLKIVG